MKNVKPFGRMLLLLALVTSAGAARALGLGDVEVRSALGSPLEAEIPLLGADEVTIEGLEVEIPGYWDQVRLGLAAPVVVDGMRASVESGGNGPVVRLSSERPVKEPLLNFLVRLRTAGEGIVREYAMILDPPALALARAARQSARSASANAAPVAEAPRGPTTAPAPMIEPGPPPTSSANTYGPVQAGETLFGIVRRVYPTRSAQIGRIADLVFAANPSAFISDDADRLRVGAVLELPSEAHLSAAVGSPNAIAPVATTAESPGVGLSPERTIEYGPVRPGETLFAIARSLAGERSAHVGDIVRWIHAHNPDAFIAGDPDRLRHGVMLEVPALGAPDGTSIADGVASPEESVQAATGAEEAAAGAAEAERAAFGEALARAEQAITRERERSSALRARLDRLEQRVLELHAQSTMLADRRQALRQRIAALLENGSPSGDGTETSLAQPAQATLVAEEAPVTVAPEPISDSPSVAAATEPGVSSPAVERPATERSLPPVFSQPAAEQTTPVYARLLELPGVPLAPAALLLLLCAFVWRAWRASSAKREGLVDHRDLSPRAQAARERLAEVRKRFGRRPASEPASFTIDAPEPESEPELAAENLPSNVYELDEARARRLAHEAELCLAYGEYEQAQAKIEEARRLDPARDEHRLVQLSIYQALGLDDEARALGDELRARREQLPSELRERLDALDAAQLDVSSSS